MFHCLTQNREVPVLVLLDRVASSLSFLLTTNTIVDYFSGITFWVKMLMLMLFSLENVREFTANVNI